ncbi:MAG: DASS family sodium-coupled anion symporter, partial [Saprospiraceae bacterium]|nr:DASS family sodium-coupled anion symporter [Saprospiraceae bacterium]
MLGNRIIFTILGPFVFALMLIMGGPDSMSPAAYAVLAATLWIAIWWITEAVPIPVTSLLPIVLYPLCGVMTIEQAAEPYSRPIIYLFVGGFLIALAMERWNLHKRIALSIIAMVGTNMRRVLLGFMLATWFLSMWISNTATTVMMLPIAISMITQFKTFNDRQDEALPGAEQFGKAVILALAFSSSIGGIATLVGTPTNLIFAESVRDFYNVEIPFDQWFVAGLPLAVILLVVLYWHLTRNHFHFSQVDVKGSREMIEGELRSLGRMSKEEKLVLAIFSLVAVAWITRRYLITPFFPEVNDINIVLVGAVSLFLIPAPSDRKERLMDWKTALKLPWGVLLLFGGAFAVAAGFEISGLTSWIGDKLSLLKGVPFWLVLLVVVTVVNYLTEITQNMATCTLMMPIMAALSHVLDVHPFGLMAGTCIAASCA